MSQLGRDIGIITASDGRQWLMALREEREVYDGGTKLQYWYMSYRYTDNSGGSTFDDAYDLMGNRELFSYQDDTYYDFDPIKCEFSPDGSQLLNIMFFNQNIGVFQFNKRSIDFDVDEIPYISASEDLDIVNMFSGGWDLPANSGTKTYNDSHTCNMYIDQQTNTIEEISVTGSGSEYTEYWDYYNEWDNDVRYSYKWGIAQKLEAKKTSTRDVVMISKGCDGECDCSPSGYPEPPPNCGMWTMLNLYTRTITTTDSSIGYYVHAEYPEFDFLLYTEIEHTQKGTNNACGYTIKIGQYMECRGVKTKLHEIDLSYEGDCESSLDYQAEDMECYQSTGGDFGLYRRICIGTPISPNNAADSYSFSQADYNLYAARKGVVVHGVIHRLMNVPSDFAVWPNIKGHLGFRDILLEPDSNKLIVTLKYSQIFKDVMTEMSTGSLLGITFDFSQAEQDFYDVNYDNFIIDSNGAVSDTSDTLAPGFVGDKNSFGYLPTITDYGS